MFGKSKTPAPLINFTSIESLDAELEADEKDIKELPFTCTLTPQEIYILGKSGYEPMQVVIGTIVYSMGLKGLLRTFMRAFQRGEMADFSHLQRTARELAIARMRGKAASIGSDGVVNTTIYFNEYADFIEVVVTGTAVRKLISPIQGDAEIVVGT